LYHSVFERNLSMPADAGPWQDAATRTSLALCQAIVNKQGGQIGVETVAERGNKFWLSMTKAPPDDDSSDL
ncbi:MAG: hypothetical protein ACRD3W_21880, partial [Terriglobales bacterium]